MPGTESTIPRLFGTDGIRGRAGEPPLDRSTVRRIGAALVRARRGGAPLRLLVGRDTRESGTWVEQELVAGAAGEGALVSSVGVVPTPAVAYLTRAAGFDMGVMISASHNPFEDNGIKVFSGRGEKFGEDAEREVEAILAEKEWQSAHGDAAPERRPDLPELYLTHLQDVVRDVLPFAGVSVAVDCANGATSTVAPALFRSLGLTVSLMGNEPDGRNINLECGSTHPEALARFVVERGCQLGVAFDGDGDRAVFVDHRGRIVNGDAVLYLCARQLRSEGRLRGSAIVATVMSNIGLELALRAEGIDVVRCAVGDKYVMEEMAARGLSLGGEQSGHIIFSDYLFTGDGLCTALNVLRTMALTGRPLADLASGLVTYPQVLLNVRVRERVDLRGIPQVADAMARVESNLAGEGRLLVRYSGTEPLLRIMIEGRDETRIREWAEEIAGAARAVLG